MSQDTRNNTKTPEAVAESASSQPWSAETYADKLMDDLFSDIDRILDGSSKLPTEPVKSEYVSLQPLKIPQITVPPKVMPLMEFLSPGSTAAVETPPAKQDSVVPPATNSNDRNRRFGQHLSDKLILGAICISLLATLILWLASQKKLNWLPQLNPGATPVGQNALSPADTQFINYMLRSLEVIDRKTVANKQAAIPGEAGAIQKGVSSVTTQPQNSSANNLPQVPSQGQGPTVLERVYIPYQQPQTATNAVPPAAAQRSAGVARSPQLPQIPVAAGSAPSALPVVPIPPAPKTAIPAPAAPAPTPAPEAKHTLVGVIFLGKGERYNAALFDISGVTKRIQVGEGIGSSGWSLVEVKGDEAIIRRNGEVRSIISGQKF